MGFKGACLPQDARNDNQSGFQPEQKPSVLIIQSILPLRYTTANNMLRKVRERLRKFEKVRDISGKLEKVRESSRKFEEVGEGSRKVEKVGES